MSKKSKKSESSSGTNAIKPNKSILDFMSRTLPSLSSRDLVESIDSNSNSFQSGAQDSTAVNSLQANVPELRTENDMLQLEANNVSDHFQASQDPTTSNEHHTRQNGSDLNHLIDMDENDFEHNDSADDEQMEQITTEEFDREDEATSEIVNGGFLDTYFASIQSKIDTKDPYKKTKSYWVYPPVQNDAVISKAAKHPEWHYYPKVFLWMPHVLMNPSCATPNSKEKLKCSHIGCNGNLNLKSFFEEPRARKIFDVHENFYLMSYRYECSTYKHGSCSGSDSAIIKQLPLRYQLDFPGHLTAGSGISKELGKLLRSCVQNSLGPSKLSKMLREFHHLRHDECEMKYLDSLSTFVERQEKSGFGDTNQYKNVQFSTFEDKDKYADSVPSGGYLTYVYCSMIQDTRPLMDQMISLLDGVVLKADHSFKIIDHIGKLNEMPIFTALYTVCNEYEEIRCQSLVATKHHSHLNSIYAGQR
ncbi:hypothetical protein BD408DRAFT_188872 [Parasitella parasitica]|nr:hypothetical protein BD408DRAFT_188872 [Parasitella parasitica]